MKLKPKGFSGRSSEENELVKLVQKFTEVDQSERIVNITYDMLYNLTPEQESNMKELRKFRYMLQYTIR